MLKLLYSKLILKYPLAILLSTLLSILFFAINIQKLEIDASAETLLLDDDKDLVFLRNIEKRFQNSSVLIIAYKPQTELLSKQSLDTLRDLTHSITKLPHITSVNSILTVPLLYSPPQDMGELLSNSRTLETPDMNFTLAKKEFLTSPLYKDSLVNKDFTTTAIVIQLNDDIRYEELLEKRVYFQHKKSTSFLTQDEIQTFETIKTDLKRHRDKQRLINTQTIKDIRILMKPHQAHATLFLGGVQMISNDIIGFVKNDLLLYGTVLVLLLIIILGIIFKSPRWIILPILICTLSVVAITSALGFWGWEITVISSNFIALQLIITISIVLHLTVRYQELLHTYPNTSSHRLIMATMLSKATPTFFSILTTIAGFSSLLLSNIHPIINLGWMMSAGIILSLIISFIVFPTVLMLLKKNKITSNTPTQNKLLQLPSNIVLNDKKIIFGATLIAIIFSITGASQLIVENSFINYFKKNTSIYKGMKIIDQELGGTTPLDVVLTFSTDNVSITEEADENSFEDEFSSEQEEEQYWFTDEKIAIIHQVHNYLDGLEETGDVQSFATILNTGKILNNHQSLDAIEIAILYKKLPKKYRDIIVSPYVNIEHQQLRFSTRIIDSNQGLRRNALLQKINSDLTFMLDKNVVTYTLSNLMVIYNNMLQSLFSSQITTLSFVVIILFIVFLFLFRSLHLTLITLCVNLIPIGLIFGFMGWFSIPLDIMTITIAAIAMGIGVDNTIHYIYRIKEEYIQNTDYATIITKTNQSVGHAMVYTSLSVMIGFSILTLSNLIPTIYFGLLTMLVMAAALISNLILLPKLLLLIKPLGK